MLDVLILAAGRGRRLRPLTDTTPKTLLRVGGKTLLEHHLERLAAQGFTRAVVNLAWLGGQIRAHLGDGNRFGMQLRYSQEPDGALETGGGIARALPLIQTDPFIVINGDILCDFNCATLRVPPHRSMHLILVTNPPHHPGGDFSLAGSTLTPPNNTTHTYAGIACLRRRLFTPPHPARFPLLPIIQSAIKTHQATATLHPGQWFDVGTAKRLEAARRGWRNEQSRS